MTLLQILDALAQKCRKSGDPEVTVALHRLVYWVTYQPHGMKIRVSDDLESVQIAKAHLPKSKGVSAILISTYNDNRHLDWYREQAQAEGRSVVTYDDIVYYSPRDPKARRGYVAWRDYTPAKAVRELWYLLAFASDVPRHSVLLGSLRARTFDALQEYAEIEGHTRKDAIVEKVATFVAENWALATGIGVEYDFEVLTGDALVRVYNTRGAAGSCMTGKPYPRFYANNNPLGNRFPAFGDDKAYDKNEDTRLDGVGIVKISLDDSYVGRALLWSGRLYKDDEFVARRVFLDRVYPSDNGPHTRAIRKWAFDQGWLMKRIDTYSDNSCVDSTLADEDTKRIDFRNPPPHLVIPGEDFDLRVEATGGPDPGWPYIDTVYYVATDETDEYADWDDVDGTVELSTKPPSRRSWRHARDTEGGLGDLQLARVCAVCDRHTSSGDRRSLWIDGEIRNTFVCMQDIQNLTLAYVNEQGARAWISSDEVVRSRSGDALPGLCVTDVTGHTILRSNAEPLAARHYGEDVIGWRPDMSSVSFPEPMRVLSRDVTTATGWVGFLRSIGHEGLGPWAKDHAQQRIRLHAADVHAFREANEAWLEDNPRPDPTVTASGSAQYRWEFE